jgi:hypothetical protein
MYSSLLALAMVGAPAQAPELSWQSYDQISQQVEKEQKPMAVFVGSGQKGWEKVAGKLGMEAENVMAASYLCAYIDTATPEGRKLAQAFEMKNDCGVVLSDRKGETQVFWHDGAMPQAELVRHLVRHSTSMRRSLYPTQSSLTGTTVLQGGSSYCPSCNSGGRRR